MKNYISVVIFFVFILSSCSTKELCSEHNNYEIVPSIGVGPYKLAMKESAFLKLVCKGYNKDEHKSWFSDDITTFYFIENMTFIFKNARLRKIVVWGTFRGMYEDIDVDYNLDELEQYGEIIKHKGEYRILEVPGISFGDENDEEGKGISVF